MPMDIDINDNGDGQSEEAGDVPSVASASEQVVASEPVASEPVTTETTELPIYRMRVGLKTVREVWREWKRGIDGGPAVEELESVWKSKWRNIKGNGNDRKYSDASNDECHCLY